MQTQSLHPLIAQKISEVAARYPTVDHALIRGLLAQRFSKEQLDLIGARFYHVIKNFPRFLAAMISHWDDTQGRMALVENLFEEHGRMDVRHIHVQTYVDFLQQMGLDHKRITASKPSPATIGYFNSVMHLCTHDDPNRGLGALAIIEDIVHQVSAIFGSAVKKEHSHIEHVSHFAEHEILDQQHSQEIYGMLDMGSPESREHALFGITMGAFFHHQLYETILAEVMFESNTPFPSWLNTPKQSEQAPYPLQTGNAGERRLVLLGKLYNDQSLAFIEKHAHKSQLQFLEIGCGTGRLSYDLAVKKPDFILVATDNALEQIDTAKRMWPPLSNLLFCTKTIDELITAGQKFDVIYLRWVLIYQKDIASVIKGLADLLSDQGCLIIEDNEPGNAGCFSISHQNEIDQWHNFWTRAVTVVGQGPGFCAQLVDTATQCGLSLNDTGINQQLLRSQAEKELFMLGVWESKEAILAAGVSQSLFDEIYNNAASISKSALPVGFVRNFQLCFNKAASSGS